MKKIIGIDIGGTKIGIGLFDEAGKPVSEKVIQTRTGNLNAAKDSFKEAVLVIKTILNENRMRLSSLRGIGICLPGPVDSERGVAPWSPNMKGWAGLPLKSMLRRALGVPVTMDNDANAAALAEKIFGAGKRTGDLVYVTVSTGIGGGLVLGGKVHRGSGFCGGEIGHMCIVPGGNLCNCGMRGCLEAYSSGTAIAKTTQAMIRSGEKGRILLKLAGGIRSITAETVGKAAEMNDLLSLEILTQAGYFLGIGIANVMNILNPGMISLGGSVMKSTKYFWSPMMKSAKEHAWPAAFRSCKVIRTSLGDRIGTLGAAALMLD